MSIFSEFQIIAKLDSEGDQYVQHVVATVRAACLRAGMIDCPTGGLSDGALVIAVGGDGTMLKAMQVAVANDCYALGINLGRIGFLTDISITDRTLDPLTETLDHVLTTKSATFFESRSMLSTEIDGRQFIAGNEIGVAPVHSDSMICYRLEIGGMDAGVHRANAILASTATGSTAYSLSAGGALMVPDVNSIQLVPVAPLTMTSRPIVVAGKSKVKITAWGGDIAVRCDGQVVNLQHTLKYTQKHPFEIQITTHKKRVKILHLKGWNFFEMLTQKLGWQKE